MNKEYDKLASCILHLASCILHLACRDVLCVGVGVGCYLLLSWRLEIVKLTRVLYFTFFTTAYLCFLLSASLHEKYLWLWPVA